MTVSYSRIPSQAAAAAGDEGAERPRAKISTRTRKRSAAQQV
jgi:hypothetical protein